MLSQPAAFGANHALLIGASGYTHQEITELKGPANDVTLMWRVLTKRGFASERITVLADKVSVGPRFPRVRGVPTRNGILNALSALSKLASAGDLVLIYFSGHGTLQPVQNPHQDPERDNLDQVMLPIDAGAYDPANKSVRNGIVDDEIGAALDAIRRRGADVWMIVDACHAGSMTRAAIAGLAVRGIEPAKLGVPPVPVRHAVARSIQRTNWQFMAKPGVGSLVGFFAVDSSREAIERSFEEFDAPMIGAGADRRMGVFTYFLYRALAGSEPIASYRDLARQIVREMQQSRIAPPAMPTFDGHLDRPLLGVGSPPLPVHWPVKLTGSNVEISAGILHGITENSALGLFAADSRQWAKAVVTKAEAVRAVASFHGPVPAERPQPLSARVLASGTSFVLSVAAPPSQELRDSAVPKLLEATKAQRKGAFDWVDSNAAADVRLRALDGRLWLLPADGELVTERSRRENPNLQWHTVTDSVEIAATAATILAEKLHHLAKAKNLVRLAEAPENSWSGIKVKAQRIRMPQTDPRRQCPSIAQILDRAGAATEEIDPKLPNAVSHCDLIRVAVENTTTRDIDVNLSYVDAASDIHNITYINAASEIKQRDCTATIPPGGRLTRHLAISTWSEKKNAPDPIGREHVVVTAVEQKDGIQNNLCFIQQAVRGVESGQRAAPGGKTRWLFAALEQAALAPAATRGVRIEEEKDAPNGAGAGMYLLTLQVMPPAVP